MTLILIKHQSTLCVVTLLQHLDFLGLLVITPWGNSAKHHIQRIEK